MDGCGGVVRSLSIRVEARWVSLAFVCAAKRMPLQIVTSDAFSKEKRGHMTALGTLERA